MDHVIVYAEDKLQAILGYVYDIATWTANYN